ncbi:1-phosphofructokinase family hexose kinase [Kineococcus sp. SYSU DK003]|uniref:1-phosphofructokinase family hexose kinase n=1 Tax=Kineococcus sp. SYSU DK003 TaxID=3383124 RepID=UPI003D7E9C95
MTPVTVVTPNPAVDLTYRVDRQRIGRTVRVREVLRRAGGKGLNVARVLHTLGVEVLAVQPLGGGAGAWVAGELAAQGIRTDSVPVEGETRSTVTVVDDVEHPTVLTEPGPVLDAGTWAALCERVRIRCAAGGVLVVSGSLPPGAGAGQVAGLVAAGHEAGARVVVDVSGPGLLAAAAAGADLLTPNAEEAREATGAADLEAAVHRLLGAGARGVVVSRGTAGLLAVDGQGRCEHPAVPGVAGNPTGAGDAATAGIAAAWARQAPPEVALRWAAVLGAAAVLRPSAGEVDPADLPALAARLPGLPAPLQPFSLPVP